MPSPTAAASPIGIAPPHHPQELLLLLTTQLSFVACSLTTS